MVGIRFTWAKFLTLCFLAIFTTFLLSGCATVPKAIEHAKLQVGYKMSPNIFLDAEELATHRNIYVKVHNTSAFKDISSQQLEADIKSHLIQKGYNIVNNPANADFILQVNVRYFDFYRETAAKEGASTGAITGGVTGALLSNSNDMSSLILAAAGAGLGYIGGAVIGSLIHVDTFAGVVDIQIKEKTPLPAEATITSNLKQGSSTTVTIHRKTKYHWDVFRTQIAVTAIKTNLDRKEAAPVVEKELARQIAEIF
jgi:uncharacterized protein YcfJ